MVVNLGIALRGYLCGWRGSWLGPADRILPVGQQLCLWPLRACGMRPTPSAFISREGFTAELAPFIQGTKGRFTKLAAPKHLVGISHLRPCWASGVALSFT